MKIGIIGLPMSGKTTLFRLLTGAPAVPPQGRVEQRQTTVEDPRLERLAADYQPRKVTPASIDFLDFPALVRGTDDRRSSCAELLAPAREAPGLIVVVRGFESPAVPPLSGCIDPAADLEAILDELRLSDLEVAAGRIERLQKGVHRKQGEERKALELELAVLEKVVQALEAGGDVHSLELGTHEARAVRGFQFLSGKPRLVVENIDAGSPVRVPEAIPVSASLELELSELDDESRAVFAEEYGFSEPARDRVIGEIYRRVGLISFLTAGDPEVRAWTIPAGSSAVEAAGAIHSDIARGFIRAEVVAYDDYVADGGIAGAREKGHFRLEGRDYVVQDGDLILFRFNV